MARIHERRPLLVTVCLAAILTVAAELVWLLGMAFVAAVVSERPEVPSESRSDVLAIDEHGMPLRVTNIYRGSHVRDWEFETRDLDGRAVELEQHKLSNRIVTLTDLRLTQVSKRWAFRERIRSLGTWGEGLWYFRDLGQDGYFELYSPLNGQRLGYLGRDGFIESEPPPSERFPTRTGFDLGAVVAPVSYSPVLNALPNANVPARWSQNGTGMALSVESDEQFRFVEPDGWRVHFIDLRKRRVMGVIDVESEAVHAVGVTWVGKSSPAILRTATRLLICSRTETPTIVRTVTLPEPVRNAGVLQWLSLGEESSGGENLFIEMREKDWRLIWSDDAGRILRERLVTEISHPPVNGPKGAEAWILTAVQSPLLVDFGIWIGHETVHPWSGYLALHRAAEFGISVPPSIGMGPFIRDATWPLLMLHLAGGFWSVLAVRRLWRFRASRIEQGFWCVWTLAFGLPGYMAFRTHRSWGRFSTCPSIRSAMEGLASSAGQVDNLAHKRRRLAASLLSAYGKLLDAGEQLGSTVAARVGLPARHTALLLKEFRLTAGIALLALCAYWVIAASSMGVRGFEWLREFWPGCAAISELPGGFFEPFVAITLLLGVSLAVWQIVMEARQQAWLFLLHRPVSRRAILVSKVVVGLGVLLGCSAMPIVLCGVWASRPGMRAAPFEWSMTIDAWRDWWSMTPVYLAMLLTMLRPARWLGTKAFPVVAAFLWLVVRSSLAFNTDPEWMECAVVVMFDAVLITCLLLVIREREFG